MTHRNVIALIRPVDGVRADGCAVDGRRRFALRHHVIYFFFSPTVHRIKRDAHQHCGSGLEPPSGLLQLFPEARRDALVAHFVVSGLDTAMRCPAAISRGASFRIDWRRRRSNLTGRKPNGILRRMNRVIRSDQSRPESYGPVIRPEQKRLSVTHSVARSRTFPVSQT